MMEKTKLEIQFNTEMDTEQVRECLEDNLGVEILGIEEMTNDLNPLTAQ